MVIYLLTLLFAYVLAILIKLSYSKVFKNSLIAILIILLSGVSGIRWQVGSDFDAYYNFFSWYPKINFNSIINPQYGSETSFEVGFSFLVWILGRINESPQFIMFSLSLLTIAPIVLTIYKYSSLFELSIFLYITSMAYYSSFNGVRQWLAAAILFWALRYIYERKIVKYFSLVLIAFSIHSSAIIFLLLYYIVPSKANSKRTIVLIGVSILFLAYFSEIIGLISTFMPSEYEGYFSNIAGDVGINGIRILVAAVPVLISYLFYSRLKRIDPHVDILINLSLFNLIFKILASQQNILNRFSIYFAIFNILLIPLFLKIFRKEDARIIYLIVIILYIIHMILLLPNESNLIPYETFLEK